MNTNTYHVIVMRPDAATNYSSLRDGSIIETVEAVTGTVAARIAKRRIAEAETADAFYDQLVNDLAIIAVFEEGSHIDVYEPSLDTEAYEKEVMGEDGIMSDQDVIEAARGRYAMPSDDTIEIDDKPKLSRGDGGCWVAAWVWVEDPEAEEKTGD